MLQNAFRPRACQRPYIRKSIEKTLLIGNSRGDARLLQHDLGNPHPIRVFRAAPWQITFRSGKPFEQCRSKACEAWSRELPRLNQGFWIGHAAFSHSAGSGAIRADEVGEPQRAFRKTR